MFETIDFKACRLCFREATGDWEKEDLLRLELPDKRLVDVGYYDSRKCFLICVVEDAKWDTPDYEFSSPCLDTIEKALQLIINRETAG